MIVNFQTTCCDTVWQELYELNYRDKDVFVIEITV
jgi:hypothetical protein